MERAKESLQRAKGDSPQRIRAAAADFEAVFVTQMFKAMRATVPEAKLFSGGFGEKVYREMLDAEHAKSLAYGGGLGLGALIARELGGEAAANALPERPVLVPAQGDLSWPVAGRVTSGFGPRSDPLTGRDSFHSGLDVSVPSGTPVRAVAAGRVVQSGAMCGYGNAVVIDHGDGYQSLYAHNSEVLAPVGTTVQPGDAVALSGSTGRSTGPHVHFEVRKGGHAVDPRAFLNGGR
jgi:murein DD-endopeptidase MepM/ murein hydrolase activator NlpD